MINADASDLIKALNKIASTLPSAVDKAMDQVAALGTANAKGTTRFRAGGKLRKETKFVNDGFLAKSVIADTGYAFYVEFGNNQKGSIIRAKGKALRFVIDGKVIFRKSVKAHGPLPFMNDARNAMIEAAPSIISTAISNVIGAA